MTDSDIHFQPLGRKTRPRPGAILLDLANDAGVSIESICSSMGRCGKCKVIVRSGSSHLNIVNDSEKQAIRDIDLIAGMRLACQAKIVTEGNIVIEVPEESRRGTQRLQAAGRERITKLKPAFMKIVLDIPPATLRDIRADDDRLLEELSKKVRTAAKFSSGVHKSIPRAIRDDSWRVSVTIFRGKEIVRLEPGDTTDELYGVAVDIGTTKVVAYLVNLQDGTVMATEMMPNPQIAFGEDVMSRITFATREKDGDAKLQKSILDGVNKLLRRLSDRSGVDRDAILEVFVVGNTAMHHMFFGIPANHLATAPYAPAVRTAMSVNSAQQGIDIYPFGKVSSLPNIAGFVGADAVAGLISSGLYRDKHIGMMIDIGTNTEIIAGNRERLISCSCASGPAFEGAHIGSGMRASTGAIERVWIDPSDWNVKISTVDDTPPRGICGSGIVDAISEMFKTGIIDSSGRINDSRQSLRVRKNGEGMSEFVLAFADDAETDHDIAVTQHDVQEIQLAKAAIFTGISTMVRKLGIRCVDIGRVYAAGAFGTYIDASSAITIGMYPDVPVDRIRFIGNSAGAGARMALKSTSIRDLADRLSKKVEYVELAAEKDFQKEFAKAMFIPHRDMSVFPSVRKP